jgi:hypothetical protein
MAYGRNGYQAAMVGRGGRHRGYRGDVMGQLEAAAEEGDPRAMAICKAIENCGEPAWRKRVIAPGVNAPCDDLYPLPMRPVGGVRTFLPAGLTVITFTARPQKPFRGERPVSIVRQIGAAGTTAVIRGGFRVGTDPQVAQISDQPVEDFDRTSFGVRMVMSPAQGGIDIEADVALEGPALVAGESIAVFLTIWGSTWA